MKQFLSILKATMKGSMSIFSIKSKNTSRVGATLLPIFLTIILLTSVGYYAYMIAEPLSTVGLTFVMLSLFVVVTILIIFMESVYKAQGILFEAKDNDVLFSMPISKTKIFFSRIIRLIVFEYFFAAIFMLPAIVIYAYFVAPTISFYLISLVMFILLPIIPTIIAVLFAYLIVWLTSLFKQKKLVQNIFSIIYTIGLFYLMFNMNGFFENILETATSINEMLTKLYYPLGLYINLITDFKILDLLILLVINIVPFILFIYLLSIKYFDIISKLNDAGGAKKSKKRIIIKKSNITKALIKKEFKRYFSSSIYIFNTVFGLVFLLIISIVSVFNPSVLGSAIESMTESGIDASIILDSIPIVVLSLVLVISSTVTITACSISLEGKSYNLTKSLPISGNNLLKAKIMTSLMITLPFLLISEICLFISFDISIIYLLIIFIATILISLLYAVLDIIVNLKYPKMEFKNDIEVVKQSASTLISILGNMCIAILILMFSFFISDYLNITQILIVDFIIIIGLLTILLTYLNKKGPQLLREINV